MAKAKLGNNAIFTAPQLGLSTLGKDHAYAYSGIQSIANTETDQLNFRLETGLCMLSLFLIL